MASRIGGSLARSFISATRAAPPASLRSSPPLPRRLRPPSSSRRSSFSPSRNLGELGCVQSLLPLHSAVAKSHLTSRLNANWEDFCLCGTFLRTCQDH